MSASPTRHELDENTLFLAFDVEVAYRLCRELQSLPVTEHYHPQTMDVLAYLEREFGLKDAIQ